MLETGDNFSVMWHDDDDSAGKEMTEEDCGNLRVLWNQFWMQKDYNR